MHLITRTFLVTAVAGWVALPAMGETIRPARDQSSEQMQKDTAECSTTASQSSGHNPSAPPAEDERHVGGRARGAAAGGAAGAAAAGVRGRQHDEAYDRLSDDAKQQYRRNQAEDAAAAGAAVGASRQRRERRADRAEDRSAEEAADAYVKAYHGCLTSRGYEVAP